MTGGRSPWARYLTHPTAGILGLVAVLVGVSVLLLSTLDPVGLGGMGFDGLGGAGLRPLPTGAVAALFCAAELFTVHLETRRSAHTVNLRELPVVLGLAFLTPLGFLAGHVLGST